MFLSLHPPFFCLCSHMFCLLNSSRFLGPRGLEKPHLVDFFQASNDSTEMANLTDAGGNLRSLEVLPCFWGEAFSNFWPTKSPIMSLGPRALLPYWIQVITDGLEHQEPWRAALPFPWLSHQAFTPSIFNQFGLEQSRFVHMLGKGSLEFEMNLGIWILDGFEHMFCKNSIFVGHFVALSLKPCLPKCSLSSMQAPPWMSPIWPWPPCPPADCLWKSLEILELAMAAGQQQADSKMVKMVSLLLIAWHRVPWRPVCRWRRRISWLPLKPTVLGGRTVQQVKQRLVLKAWQRVLWRPVCRWRRRIPGRPLKPAVLGGREVQQVKQWLVLKAWQRVPWRPVCRWRRRISWQPLKPAVLGGREVQQVKQLLVLKAWQQVPWRPVCRWRRRIPGRPLKPAVLGGREVQQVKQRLVLKAWQQVPWRPVCRWRRRIPGRPLKPAVLGGREVQQVKQRLVLKAWQRVPWRPVCRWRRRVPGRPLKPAVLGGREVQQVKQLLELIAQRQSLRY